MSSLQTLPKGDSAWLFRKAIERIMKQVSVLETNIGSSTTGNSSNTQIIFNDAGTLRGDAGLTYNAATNTLSAGSAIITGDLAVDTSTLKVDSTNNYVGIGTAAPIAQFISVLNATGIAGRLNTNTIGSAISASYQVSGVTSGTLPFGIRCTGNAFTGISGQLYASQIVAESTSALALEMFTTGNTPICFGVNGAETMRLNATGLGIGASPTDRLTVWGASTTNGDARFNVGLNDNTSAALGTGAGLYLAGYTNGTAGAAIFASIKGIKENGTAGNTAGALVFTTLPNGGSNVERMRIDSAGNVGIGVVPSAWLPSYKSIDILAQAAFFASNTAAFVGSNLYVASGGVVTYKTANNASYFAANNSGVFSWYRSNNTPVANGAATFTESMQVDANGNLILQSSATPATLTTNGQLTVNATSNTNLRFSYRGSDGVTRVANITLA